MNKKIFYLFLLLVLVGTIFGASAYLQTVFSQLTGTIDAYVSHHFFLGSVIFMGLAALSVLLGPFTSAPLIPFAVVIWGIPLTLTMLLGGWLLGNAGAFWIGRYLGHPLVAKILGHKKLRGWAKGSEAATQFFSPPTVSHGNPVRNRVCVRTSEIQFPKIFAFESDRRIAVRFYHCFRQRRPGKYRVGHVCAAAPGLGRYYFPR